jgi:hypothetical protein
MVKRKGCRYIKVIESCTVRRKEGDFKMAVVLISDDKNVSSIGLINQVNFHELTRVAFVENFLKCSQTVSHNVERGLTFRQELVFFILA